MSTKSGNRREFLKSSAMLSASLGLAGSAAWRAHGATAPQGAGAQQTASGTKSAMAAKGASGANGSRPNILFICTDQQRVDDMSCAGNPYVKTPAVDSLAARGARFTRSYCAFPLCSPSRATHVMSRMTYEIGINRNGLRLPESVPSLGTIFKAAGYRTVWTGKWHLPSTYPTTQEVPGFELLFHNPKGKAGAAAKAQDAGKKAPAGEKAATPGDSVESEEKGRPGTYNDPLVVKTAIQFLKEKRTEPFLLAVSLLNPHDICGFNQGTPAKLNLPTDPSTMPPPPANLDAPDLGPGNGGKFETNTVDPAQLKKQNFALHWDDLTWRQQWYYYYQLTERVDRLIGDLLNALRETGQEENTLVLFTSDHGEMAGAHRRIRKMSFYEEAMTVPYILAGPGVPRGVTDKAHLISGLDVMPTLCDFAGLAAPDVVRGLSVKKVLDDPKAPWRDAVYAALNESSGRMVCTGRYKYNLYGDEKKSEELFDLEKDKGETKNLVSDPAMAETLAAHRKALRDWMEKTNDPFGKPAAATAEAPKSPKPAKPRSAGGGESGKGKANGKGDDSGNQKSAKKKGKNK